MGFANDLFFAKKTLLRIDFHKNNIYLTPSLLYVKIEGSISFGPNIPPLWKERVSEIRISLKSMEQLLQNFVNKVRLYINTTNI